ncbi:hypothetical protein V2O64_24890 (plasmid) [Verrucomicrobiaceae bacterium 227]
MPDKESFQKISLSEKEKERRAIRERQARFRKKKAQDSVRLEIRVSRETEELLATLMKRAGKRHKNVFAAELLSDLVRKNYSKTVAPKAKPSSGTDQESFNF